MCAGRNDAKENPRAGHPGKYSAEYSFKVGSGPRGDLAAVAEPELDQDGLDVGLRRAFGDVQGLADLLVGQPARDQLGDLDLPGAHRRAGPPNSRPARPLSAPAPPRDNP